MDGVKRRYYALCRDAVSGMEFDFELDSTRLRAAREEADCKYNGVVFVGARPHEGGGGGGFVDLPPAEEKYNAEAHRLPETAREQRGGGSDV